jgi:hypothetical protein
LSLFIWSSRLSNIGKLPFYKAGHLRPAVYLARRKYRPNQEGKIGGLGLCNEMFFLVVEETMMTRRSAVLLALGLPAWGFDDKEFWNQKKPSDWSASEIKQMLSQSPWAKPASVYNNTGASGPLGGSRSGGGGRRGGGGRGGGGGGAVSTNPGSVGGPNNWKTIVRWESSLPMREALKVPPSVAAGENYIIALVGSIPSVGIPSKEDDPDERKRKLEILQDFTLLERRDEPLNLTDAAAGPTGTLFYFSRVFAIKPEDKQVTFVTKLGSLEIKCKFSLKDMVYRGNLEL